MNGKDGTEFQSEKTFELPVTFIDLVFLFLIFFLSTFTVGGSVFVQKTVKREGKTIEFPFELPDGQTDKLLKREDVNDGVVALIKTNEDLGKFEYYLLGYDFDAAQMQDYYFTESNLDTLKYWRKSIFLSKENARHDTLIGSFPTIQEDFNNVYRYGVVLEPSYAEYDTMRANIALFLEYMRGLKKFENINALDFSIKAEKTVNIGAINEFLEICGIHKIPNVNFILKERVAGG